MSGLAGSGDAQRANSWQNKVGPLPGVALPVDVSQLPAKPGSAPSTSTSEHTETSTSIDANQAVADAQAGVDAAQSALDDYLASAGDDTSTQILTDIDSQLDELAADIATTTSMHPEKDGGVTVQGGGDNGRYLTAEQYRNALVTCTTSAGDYDPAKRTDQQNVSNLSIGQPAKQPSAPTLSPSMPATAEPSAPTPSPSMPAAPEASAPSPAAAEDTNPSDARLQTLATTGSSAVWVAVGALAVLIAGISALVASWRAKN